MPFNNKEYKDSYYQSTNIDYIIKEKQAEEY